MTTTSSLPRVLSYPHSHPYVDALTEVSDVVHTDVAAPGLAAYYDPSWIGQHAGDWDVAHLHFGHEQHPVARVVATVRAHRRAGVRVVFTVHDLGNPNVDPEHDRTMALLEGVKDEVDVLTTLTRSAAATVEEATGRRPAVIPHGPLVPGARRGPRRPGQDAPLVVIGRRRPNHDVVALGEAMAIARTPVRIIVRPQDATAVRTDLADGAVWALWTITERLPHRELERLIAACSGLVLCYRWGSHSGLLEVAADLHVPTVVPDRRTLLDQRRIAYGHVDEVPALTEVADHLDVGGLADSLRWLTHHAPTRRFHPHLAAHRDDLEADRAETHRRIYAGDGPVDLLSARQLPLTPALEATP